MTQSLMKNKVLIWVLLIVFAATSVMSTGTAFAAAKTAEPVMTDPVVSNDIAIDGDIPVISEDAAADEDTASDVTYLDVVDDEEEIVAAIREGMVARESTIPVYVTCTEELSDEVLNSWLEMVFEETGVSTEGDYLRAHFDTISLTDGSGYKGSDGNYYYSLNFDCTYYSTAEQEEKLTAAVDELMEWLLESDMTDYNIISTLHSYIASAVAYDYDGLEDDSDITKYTAYGALVEGEAVCHGYSALMYRLLTEAGISTRIISGTANNGTETGAHAWNIVYLDGSWYNLDTTWESCLWETSEEWLYLLKGSESFDVDHFAGDEYTTAEFNEAYPISETDYVYEGYDDDDEGMTDDFIYGYCDEDNYFKEGYVEFDEGVGSIALPDSYNSDEGITIYRYSWLDDTEKKVYSGKISADGATVTVEDSDGIEYDIEITIEPDSSFYEYIGYSVNAGYGDMIFFDNDNCGTVELPYDFEEGTYVDIVHYEGNAGTVLWSSDEITSEGVLPFSVFVNDGGKATEYTIEVVIGEPSSDTGCNFDISVDTENYGTYNEYYTEDADEEGNLYMTVPYGTFSDETAKISIFGFPYEGTIDGEYTYAAELPFELGTSKLTHEVTVIAEDGTEKTWTLVITEDDGSCNTIDEFIYAVISDKDGNIIEIPIEADGALITDESDEGLEVAIPAYYYQDVEESCGIYLYSYGNNAIIEGLNETYYLDNGEKTVTITATPVNPDYAENVNTYKFKFVQETGSSTELDELLVHWYTQSFFEDDLVTGEYARGVISVDLDDAKKEDGATVKVPATFFELSERYDIVAVLTAYIDAAQYSYITCEDWEYDNESFDVLYEYLAYNSYDDSFTYTFDVTGADVVNTQQYKFTVVKSTEVCTNPSWSDWEVIEPATCEAIGIQIRICEVCGEIEYQAIPVSHNFTELNYDETDHWYECECGEINEDSIEEHQVDSWTITEEPQVGVPGSKTGVCTVCEYEVTEEIPALEAEPVEITKVEIADTSYTYNGKAIEPEVTVYDAEGTVLKKDRDYTVAYENNTNVGTATVTVTGMSNYYGTLTDTFEITAQTLNDERITATVGNAGRYDGTAKEPALTVKFIDDDSGIWYELQEGTDYTVEYKNNTEVGTATAVLTGTNNFTGTKEAEFVIKPALITDATMTVADGTYTGSAVEPAVTVTLEDGTVLVKGTDYTVSYENNTNAGTAAITVTGAGNYSGTLTDTFTIEPADISAATVTTAKTKYTYDGTAKEPSVTVKSGSVTLTKGTDYTVAYKDNIEIGTATVLVTGTGNYIGTASATFEIAEGIAVFEDSDILRIYGSDRYGTTIKAADVLKDITGQEKYDTVIVACGTNFADALAGSYLAKVTDAPILVVDTNSKSSMNRIKKSISNNLVSGGKVYLLGGEGAISKSFADSLKGYDVTRLGGSDRYETNVKILKEADKITGAPASDILVCTGTGFADSLSASAVGKPILLVGDKLTTSQKTYLKNSGIDEYYLIGGTSVVSANIAKAADSYGDVERIYGANRYETSAKIAAKFFPGQRDTVVIAVGDNFPDGLSGGPVAMALDAPLLLINEPHSAYKYAASYADKCGAENAAVLGGTGLISDKVVNKIIK